MTTQRKPLWMRVLATCLVAALVIGVAGRGRVMAMMVPTQSSLAYDRAHDAVTAEESLERKYRLEPSDAVRRAMAAVSEVAMLAVPSRNPSMPRGSAPSPGRKPVCRQRSLPDAQNPGSSKIAYCLLANRNPAAAPSPLRRAPAAHRWRSDPRHRPRSRPRCVRRPETAFPACGP